jgi:S1-C subfamily serine protease
VKPLSRPVLAFAAASLGMTAGVFMLAEDPDPVLSVHVMSDKDSPFIGTVWRVEGGWFVTAYHVPCDEDGLLVDGRPAEIVALDKEADLAVLRVPGLYSPCLPLGSARVGQEARVEGFVGVQAHGYHMTTYGRITSRSLPDGFTGYDGGVQPGLSGSPVLDNSDRVVGVVSSAQTWNFGPNATMGRLCNVDRLREMLAELRPGAPALPVPSSRPPVVVPPPGPVIFEFEFPNPFSIDPLRGVPR